MIIGQCAVGLAGHRRLPVTLQQVANQIDKIFPIVLQTVGLGAVRAGLQRDRVMSVRCY